MAQPGGPHQPPVPPNRQVNKAKNRSNVFTNNNGTQTVSINQAQAHPRRGWAWVSLAILSLSDTGYFVYGQSAYTGGADQDGDLIRAAIFLVLMVVTVAVARVCARDIRQRWF
ncbi:hypothetical protein [Nocardia aurantia]|uniref:Uncharacterized protein n=1 Tax=Nocardia aurantia TaxID=2585199 RepID=A0A7K0DPP0_9NOCA|nr:hypothetical protein [Nocardia aurantia]MQY27699.1 hypothetical protein [Nocardia aurantia]